MGAPKELKLCRDEMGVTQWAWLGWVGGADSAATAPARLDMHKISIRGVDRVAVEGVRYCCGARLQAVVDPAPWTCVACIWSRQTRAALHTHIRDGVAAALPCHDNLVGGY